MQRSEKRAIIIGSGIAGLAAAVRLSCKGYSVKVFEANTYAGGKLTAFEQKGYRFDAGPSLFTMPQYVDELFELGGKKPADYIRYNHMPESCRYFWDDGIRMTAPTDTEDFALEAEKTTGVKAVMVRKKLEKSKLMYEKAGRIFLEKPLHKLSTWLSKDVLKSLAYIPSLGLLSTMHKSNKKELKNHRLVQIFDRYATYNGSDPYRAPAALNIIPHLEHGIGTYLPENGMHEIATSILRLAKELGAEFHFEEKVEEIIIKNKRATGVKTKNGVYESDIVVSNMDITPTYRNLLKGHKAPERILSRERSSSALIFYWGIKKEFPELGLHNILFSNNYREEFRSIFNDNLPYHDPTVYITVSSKLVKSDAPAGCENWFVMINLSSNRGRDYEDLIPVYRKIIIDKINSSLKTDISGLIECETVLDPLNIELKTSSAGGSLYGSSSNSRFAAFMRHANESRRIKGLYFTGGSVHPGGGIPLCLLSAKITSELIDKE